MPEKLLTIKEVSQYLGISEEEVKRLVDIGEIPAYRIGGSFLRFRKEQIDAVKSEVDTFEKADAEHVKAAVVDVRGKTTHTYTDLERETKRHDPNTRKFDYTIAERVWDFFYFYDFYVVSFAVIFTLLYIIIYRA